MDPIHKNGQHFQKFYPSRENGDWELHLSCVRNMLYFHSTGRHLYAKCTHLYLQDMLQLDDATGKIISKNFTIRRSEKFWSGVWSDLTIEQTVMRSMKSVGGLVHGRSMTEDVTNQWILSMPSFSKVRRSRNLPTYQQGLRDRSSI